MDQCSDVEKTNERHAILFTDLQNSTEWFDTIGSENAFNALEIHFRVLENSIQNNCGEIVKRTGDGLMAAFPKLVLAIDAAIEAQKELDTLRSDERTPLNLPPMRVGISAGEAYFYTFNNIKDYFGRVCAEACRFTEIAGGHHIIVSHDALKQESISAETNLTANGIKLTSCVSVFFRGLNEVNICEVRYHTNQNKRTEINQYPIDSCDGLISPQTISRSRPDLAPFKFYENSEKAKSDMDQFLLNSTNFNFLHVRGIVESSSSPFNRFMNLLKKNKFKDKVESVSIGILNPDNEWLTKYYLTERNLSQKECAINIELCKYAFKAAKLKLKKFVSNGKIRNWEMFLYEMSPVWRMVLTEKGVIATPYGGPYLSSENIVLFAVSNMDPIYHSFKRWFDTVRSMASQIISA